MMGCVASGYHFFAGNKKPSVKRADYSMQANGFLLSPYPYTMIAISNCANDCSLKAAAVIDAVRRPALVF